MTPDTKKRKITNDTIYIADLTKKEATQATDLAAVHADHARDLDEQVLNWGA